MVEVVEVSTFLIVWQRGFKLVSVTRKVRPEWVKEVAVRESPWMMEARGSGLVMVNGVVGLVGFGKCLNRSFFTGLKLFTGLRKTCKALKSLLE